MLQKTDKKRQSTEKIHAADCPTVAKLIAALALAVCYFSLPLNKQVASWMPLMVYHGSEQLRASAIGSKPSGFSSFDIAESDRISPGAIGSVNGAAWAVAGAATFAVTIAANKTSDCFFLDILLFIFEDFHS